MLVKLDQQDGKLVPGRFLRADDLDGKLGEDNNPEWKTVAFDEISGSYVAPNGSVGYRWGEDGEWNLEEKAKEAETRLKMSLVLEEDYDDVVGVDFPYFGGEAFGQFETDANHPDVLTRNIPVKKIKTKDGVIAVPWQRSLTCFVPTTALIVALAAIG